MTVQKNLKKKIIIPVCIGVLAVAAVVFCILAFNKKDNSFSVGFFEVPEDVSESIKTKITQNYGEEEITFNQIEDSEILEKNFSSKYDIIFSPNGSFIDSMEKYSKEFPAQLYSNMPRSITDKNRLTIPVLLDHYEFAYYRPSRTNALNIPQTLEELQDYLEQSKKIVFSPFFCAGGDDKTLLALVSALTEAYGGTEAYQQFCNSLQKEMTLKSVAQTKLPLGNEKAGTFTVIDILDMLRTWKENEYVHPNWYNATFNDVKIFMEDKQIAVVFMPLSFHRTISYRVIRDFESERIPMRSVKDNHGVIAPEYVGIKLSKDDLCDSIFATLLEENNQTNLSDQTKLAPVNSRCAAFDRQADDVRFYAAACKDGPLPPLYEAVFQINKDKIHPFAQEIRTYLQYGIFN